MKEITRLFLKREEIQRGAECSEDRGDSDLILSSIAEAVFVEAYEKGELF